MPFNTSKVLFENLDQNIQSYFNNLNYNSQSSYDAAYLINLDRSPERLKRASNELEMANLKYQRFAAVDGYKLEIKSLNNGEIITGQQLKNANAKTTPNTKYKISYDHSDFGNFSFNFEGSFTAGELGVLASHIAIWRDASNKGYNTIIIFEDDIVIYDHKNFNQQITNFIKHLPENFDAAFIDYHQVEGERYEILGNNYINGISDNFIAWGSHAVVYSKKGIDKLSSHFIYSTENDIMMFKENNYFEEKGLKTYVSEIKFLGTTGESSTITDMGRGKAYDNLDM